MIDMGVLISALSNLHRLGASEDSTTPGRPRPEARERSRIEAQAWFLGFDFLPGQSETA